MAYLSSDNDPQSTSASPTRFGFSTFTSFGALADVWRQYRMLRELESVPASVMKDVGFPAAERMHAA